MNIFVSYTTRDKIISTKRLRKIEKLLSYYGKPYIDLLHNNSDDPQSFVLSRLASSAIFYVCWTPAYLESGWTQLELYLALKNNISIVWLDIENILKFNHPERGCGLPLLPTDRFAGGIVLSKCHLSSLR